MPSPPPKLVEILSASLTIPGSNPGDTFVVSTGFSELRPGDIAVVNFPTGLTVGLAQTPPSVISPPVPPSLQITFTNHGAVAIPTQNVPMQVLIVR